MISLTRKTDYALVALTYLGHHRAEGKTVSARRIADQFGMPLPLLMNVLKELTHAGLVTSTRGPQGGYTLASEPPAISVLDVVTAIEGPVRVAMCIEDKDHAGGCTCAMEGRCNIEQPIRRLNQQLSDFLARVTLSDLMETPVKAGIGFRISSLEESGKSTKR